MASTNRNLKTKAAGEVEIQLRLSEFQRVCGNLRAAEITIATLSRTG